MRLMLLVAYLHAISIRNAAEADVRDLKVLLPGLGFCDKLCAGRRELLSLILRDGCYHELCEC
jgi:hypothetical protein